jgi:hypothetical protein
MRRLIFCIFCFKYRSWLHAPCIVCIDNFSQSCVGAERNVFEDIIYLYVLLFSLPCPIAHPISILV